MNEKALQFFADLAQRDTVSQTAVKFSDKNDFTQLDADFILRYASDTSQLLDIGSGTGLIVNKLYDKVQYIEAVEPFKTYSDFIVRADNVNIVNVTHETYRVEKVFDFVLCFGFSQYLNAEEAANFYKKFYHALKQGGKILVKNQFGVREDVLISRYSDEINAMYFSEYRTVDHEKKLLSEAGFAAFEVVDIYPPECSRWNNTHYYAIVAEKNA